MFRPLLLVVLLTMLSSCMPQREILITRSSFNENEVAWFKEEGTNTIKGSALLRQSGGGIVTCAGNKVEVAPRSTYATERMLLIYGNTDQGYYDFASATTQIDQGVAAYYETAKETICDAQGFFKFNNLPDGQYYVVVKITWVVANRLQGGYLMKRVKVSGGETKEIVLTS